MKTLLLLRHAKSDWNSADLGDHERPLNNRGTKSAQKMGQWMRKHHIHPEWIICSSATRTRQTLELIAPFLHIPDSLKHFDDRLYLAELDTLLTVLAGCPDDINSVMLIGHNPGMELLVQYLCEAPLPLSENGKLMTTAALAKIGMPDDWHHLAPGCGTLKRIIRPKEI